MTKKSKDTNEGKKGLQGRAVKYARDNLLFVTVVALFAITLGGFALDVLIGDIRSSDRQAALQPFYTPPEPLPAGRPGDIIRSEPLGVDVPGGQGVRILYLTEQSDGTPRAASGMVFYPAAPAPATGRPIVAWAHPTTGMGDTCAPSRADNPLADMTWLGDMLSHGWVVTATDYAGLGTPGDENYMVGVDEARDVINSVRAARLLDGTGANSTYATWGHSQGGHAALFTQLETSRYAPELNLVATAVAAPAAELAPLINEQYRSPIGWVIGPEIAVSWPANYPGLNAEELMTATGAKRYQKLADDCLEEAGLEGKVLSELRQDFFKTNPMGLPAWYSAATNETPRLPVGSKPVLIAQGIDDQVVLPNTTSLLIKDSCEAGVNVSSLWLGGTGHMTAAKVAGPSVVLWLQDRFENKPATPVCGQALPAAPAPVPPPPAAGS